MRPAGQRRINPWVTDEFERAEAEYRAAQDFEPPVHGTAKFRVHDQEYLFDQARPILRRALELNTRRSKRSNEAVWLEVALHADALDRFAVFRCQGKLLEIYEQLKPI